MRITVATLKEALANQPGWVESSHLANQFGVTQRTIRNYVRRANELESPAPIESSYRGYRLAPAALDGEVSVVPTSASPHPVIADSQEDRAGHIVRSLLGERESQSVYDLADELHVSDSTIESDLRRVRSILRPLNLSLTRVRDLISIKGSERDKRRLINRLIQTENPGSFTAMVSRGIYGKQYDVESLLSDITDILSKNGLCANDFGLNTIELHILIMTDRIRQGCVIEDRHMETEVEVSSCHDAAQEICRLVATKNNLAIGDDEVYYLALVIMSNTSKSDYSFANDANMDRFIDGRSLEVSTTATHRLEQAYLLDPFDGDFVTRLAMHVHSLVHRIPSGMFAQNPLAAEIKSSYPLIYDMAVYLSSCLSEQLDIPFNEDEISFLAFHIGGYFEKNNLKYGRVTCAFLHVDYHDIHETALARIRALFGSDIILVKVCSVTDYRPEDLCCDLVISPIKVDPPRAGRIVRVSPLLGDDDLERIRREVDAALASKRGALASSILQKFLKPSLFKKNLDTRDETGVIREISGECTRRGLCSPTFVDDVLARERISSTAFGSQVAVPHSMSPSALSPFLYVVVNEQPISWGGQSVSIVLLIGIGVENREEFRILFDVLLKVLRNPANVRRLVRCSGYDDFAEQLETMVASWGEPAM